MATHEDSTQPPDALTGKARGHKLEMNALPVQVHGTLISSTLVMAPVLGSATTSLKS